MPSGATNNRIDKRKVASAVTNMKKKKNMATKSDSD